MRNIIFFIGLYLILNLILVKSIFGQYCYLDFINDKELQYNQSGKLELIIQKGIVVPSWDSAYFCDKLTYNEDSLIASITNYSVTFSGDTVEAPVVTKTYEYIDGLISEIHYIGVIAADFIWENNKVTEYKYYYFLNDSTIDSSQTRILQFTYLNDNIHHFLYKEISSGTTYADYYRYYDNKINPYYNSEIGLINGYSLEYASSNNWISTSSGMSRTITYNPQNYPIYIYTDYNNGNTGYDTLTYNCTNSTYEQIRAYDYELEFLPNPTHDFFLIRSNVLKKIKEVKIFDLNGVKLMNIFSSEKINVNGLKPGIYIVECSFEGITLRKKLIVYTS